MMRGAKVSREVMIIDQKTGEAESALAIEKQKNYLANQWRRVVLESLFDILNRGISNQKMKVIHWIMENLNSDNQLIYTQAQISEYTSVSKPTINELFKFLLENDFMKKQGAGFIINPAIIGVVGDEQKNLNVLIRYKQVNTKDEVRQVEDE